MTYETDKSPRCSKNAVSATNLVFSFISKTLSKSDYKRKKICGVVQNTNHTAPIPLCKILICSNLIRESMIFISIVEDSSICWNFSFGTLTVLILAKGVNTLPHNYWHLTWLRNQVHMNQTEMFFIEYNLRKSRLTHFVGSHFGKIPLTFPYRS